MTGIMAGIMAGVITEITCSLILVVCSMTLYKTCDIIDRLNKIIEWINEAN